VSLENGSFAHASGHRVVTVRPKSGMVHESAGWVRQMYGGHSSAISALASACIPDLNGGIGWLVASGVDSSGQNGGFGEVHVWNATSCNRITSIGGMSGGIRAI